MDARRYVCVCVHALLFPSSIRVPWFVLASKRILPLSDNAAALCWQRTGDGRARSYIGRGARRLLQLAAGDCAGHRRQRLREPAYSPGDRRDGLWFAGDAASSATWRPGWWRISQDPDEIRVCFAWRDGDSATERVYTRHPQFHFYSSAAAGSAAHVKLLLPLSSDGRWSRVAPILLQNAPLRQFQPAPSAAANQNDGRSSPSAGGATEAE